MKKEDLKGLAVILVVIIIVIGIPLLINSIKFRHDYNPASIELPNKKIVEGMMHSYASENSIFPSHDEMISTHENLEDKSFEELEVVDVFPTTWFGWYSHYGQLTTYEHFVLTTGPEDKIIPSFVIIAKAAKQPVEERVLFVAWSISDNHEEEVTLLYELMNPGDVISIPTIRNRSKLALMSSMDNLRFWPLRPAYFESKNKEQLTRYTVLKKRDFYYTEEIRILRHRPVKHKKPRNVV